MSPVMRPAGGCDVAGMATKLPLMLTLRAITAPLAHDLGDKLSEFVELSRHICAVALGNVAPSLLKDASTSGRVQE